MQVLLVEDNKRLSDAMAEIMRSQDYVVDCVFDGDDGIFYAEQHDYDIIVLDVMLPKKDGFEVLKELRASNVTTPILMLTARDAVSDKVHGLDAGADDYMTKPFVPAELLARIRSLTRRSTGSVTNTLTFGDLELDEETCELKCSDKSVQLGAKELGVMHELLVNKSNVTSKDNLIENVWGYDSDVEENNVEAYISFLRKKLKFLDSNVKITTLRMLGYKLDTSED
jgi:two-component system, OmpR family, response regulator